MLKISVRASRHRRGSAAEARHARWLAVAEAYTAATGWWSLCWQLPPADPAPAPWGLAAAASADAAGAEWRDFVRRLPVMCACCQSVLASGKRQNQSRVDACPHSMAGRRALRAGDGVGGPSGAVQHSPERRRTARPGPDCGPKLASGRGRRRARGGDLRGRAAAAAAGLGGRAAAAPCRLRAPHRALVPARPLGTATRPLAIDSAASPVGPATS
jgi:hypothetical protein